MAGSSSRIAGWSVRTSFQRGNCTCAQDALDAGTSTYDAFGNLLDDSATLGTNYLYTGQQYDPLTELYEQAKEANAWRNQKPAV